MNFVPAPVAEWLRRGPAKAVGSPRVRSNRIGCVFCLVLAPLGVAAGTLGHRSKFWHHGVWGVGGKVRVRLKSGAKIALVTRGTC